MLQLMNVFHVAVDVVRRMSDKWLVKDVYAALPPADVNVIIDDLVRLPAPRPWILFKSILLQDLWGDGDGLDLRFVVIFKIAIKPIVGGYRPDVLIITDLDNYHCPIVFLASNNVKNH